MTFHRRFFATTLALAAALGFWMPLSGCSKAKTLEKMPISGKVTHNGKPLENGEILFKPLQDSKVPPSAAIITNGEYKAPAGIAAGTYRVEVMGYKAVTTKELSPGGLDRPPQLGAMPMGRENYLPEKFNTKTTLENLVVQSGKPVEKNYDLKD